MKTEETQDERCRVKGHDTTYLDVRGRWSVVTTVLNRMLYTE